MIKVLIVDDSIVYRSQIKAAFARMPQVEVVGSAANGKIALEKIKSLSVDLITLDLEMPEMGGIDFLKSLKSLGHSMPKVIVFSSISRAGAEVTLDALRLGATDFALKPGSGEVSDHENPADKVYRLLEPKVSSFFGNHVLPTETTSVQYPKISLTTFRPKVLVIGSSTGGPNALETIFLRLKAPVACPILIAQHMPPIFTQNLAHRLAQLSGIPAAEAKHEEKIVSNRIYIAPGDFHFQVGGSMQEPIALLDQGNQIHSVRPAVDPLFTSAARIFGARCLGLILTGMGQDGRDGAVQVKRHGGGMIIQDRASSVVFGMPGSVQSSGAYDQMGNLEEIEALLTSIIK